MEFSDRPQGTYFVKISTESLSPEAVLALEGNFVAFGSTPENAIAALREKLSGALAGENIIVDHEIGIQIVDEEKLIRELKDKGPEDEQTKKLLLQWTLLQEKLVEKEGGSTFARIAFERKSAALYRCAGFEDDAIERWQGALIIATQEGREDLIGKILAEMHTA